MVSRKGKGTRRKTALKSRALTIPELKHCFDTVETETYDLLKSGLPQAETVKKFQALWKSIFHRSVTKEAAESYLQVKRGTKIRPVRKGTRRQKGGAALAGAPLDHMTRPGVDGYYGSFPAYQSSGLAFYDTINKDGLVQGCGTTDITPSVSATMGSNEFLKGGGKKNKNGNNNDNGNDSDSDD